MDNPLLRSLALLDTSGYVIIAIILTLVAIAVVLTIAIRARYAMLERELRRQGGAPGGFQSRVLNRILSDAQNARASNPFDLNTQAIIERAFDAELRGMLVGERFIKASTGLLIILGLVGTFYGLTLSIGRLVALVTGDAAPGTEVTESLMSGLAQALSGMSVAFSCSLFGICSAILMTLIGVFWNVADRRTALMVQIEAFLDNELVAAPRQVAASGRPVGPGVAMHPATSEDLNRLMQGFGASVEQLQNSVAQFEQALLNFSATTRDFREFNFHLKDNVQRMSLSFGDLSETLKEHSRAIRPRG
jgi:MotA/TolQ/ExbB proton channel family